MTTPPSIDSHLDSNARATLLAAFLGWSLDAFDFFVLTFVLAPVAAEFHRSIADIALTLTASLAMRPIGAFLFGLMADRYGRRIPLMVNILFYSVVEVLSGFAPSYHVFLALRLLYGVGMGGEWGLGATLAMEAVPAKWRGMLSGILQQGYSFGYLLAAAAYWIAFPHWGWRSLFFLGGLPALLTLFIRLRVKESEVWRARAAQHHDWGAYARAVFGNIRRFAYLVVMIGVMGFISHGTEDIYPTFLQQQRHFPPGTVALITIFSMIGAFAGGLLGGLASDHYGRRKAMVGSILIGFLAIPAWVFSPTLGLIIFGSVFMQFLVGGAWGIVPAHINELSPGAVRGFFPGLAYQLGILISSGSAYVETRMAQHMTYAQALGGFAAVALFLGAVVVWFGPEAHRVSFWHDGHAAQIEK